MFEHFVLDNPKVKTPAAHDPNYDEEEPESYQDPDFDKDWDDPDDDTPLNDRDILPLDTQGSTVIRDGLEDDILDINNSDEWEEVE